MFGLEYRTLLQRDILETIDSFDHPVSIEELKETLGYSNSVTILKSLKELSDLIDETYTDRHFSMKLINPKKGYYQLVRYSTNLQSIFQAIFSQDFAYNLIKSLVEKRSLTSIEVCQELNISESTLQRKVRLINQEIKNYGIYISCSEKVQFKSDELKVRLFSYVFLWSTNRQFSNVALGYNLSNYLYMSKEVLNHLGAFYDPLKIEILAFWIFIYSNAISRKQELFLSQEQLEIVADFEFPKKPQVILNWPDLDWKMLVITMFNSDIYDFDLAIKKECHSAVLSDVEAHSTAFLRNAEKNFSALNTIDEKNLWERFIKYSLSSFFFEFISETDSDTLHIVNLNDFKQAFPHYWKRFDKSWTSFISSDEDMERYSSMMYPALIICLSIFPLEIFIQSSTIITLFITTDVSITFSNYLKQVIRNTYKDNYRVEFTKDISKAQLIVSTIPFDREFLSSNQRLLVISPGLKKNDLTMLEELLKKIDTENSLDQKFETN